MKNYKEIFILLIVPLFVELFMTLFRVYFGMRVSAVCGFMVFLLSTYFFLKQYNNCIRGYQITGYFILGLLFLQVPARIFDFKGSLVSLPDFLVHLLGIFAGYFFYERKKLLHKINLSVSVLIVLFVYFYGYDLWMNKVDYGSFGGAVHYKAPAGINLKDKYHLPIQLDKGKLIVMDFWFIGCAACMDEFPDFQKLYSTYKNNPKIQFYSVNQPFPATKDESSFKMLADSGYTFPMAVCPDRTLTTELEISAYPTIVVLDTNGYVIYKGGMSNLEAAIKSNL